MFEITDSTVDISKFLIAISSMSSLSDPSINNHNYRVAYIAFLIGKRISYSNEFLYNLIVSGLLHDIGLLLVHTKEDLALIKEPDAEENKIVHIHSEIGYELLKNFPFFSKIAKTIKYHHYPYKDIVKIRFPISSSIIYIADRIDIFITNNLREENKFSQISKLIPKLKQFLLKQRGTSFSPRTVDVAVEEIINKECFWFEILNDLYIKETLEDILKNFDRKIPAEAFFDLAQIMAYLIDFKSPFTATHSSGVAHIAASLASLFKFTAPDLKKMKIAGLLHDIGKVAIPIDILEKPGRLTQEEVNIMKSHVFYSYKIISKLNLDPNIVQWAAFHHETLNGKGYPFHLRAKDLSLGSRIMAVADIFTALMEDRPYKKGMPEDKALSIIKELADKNILDKRVVNILQQNIKSINMQRAEAQKKAAETYKKIREIPAKFKKQNLF
ncbi:HD-GYP domain-containing protein [Desulfurobacterium atlanticum]|uniref:HDIG domain-containing protein n=1 Tax=Desulfurobacterium atlanticum TaxID=240169 RepID=A0A238ZE11_9BACT|nr:HD domain-containing phosphohydrolase [Desulfurobacterium atlanticum]SNR81756.1 HDIG domain-containing protein [Desulfurobacterium atlanticum]